MWTVGSYWEDDINEYEIVCEDWVIVLSVLLTYLASLLLYSCKCYPWIDYCSHFSINVINLFCLSWKVVRNTKWNAVARSLFSAGLACVSSMGTSELGTCCSIFGRRWCWSPIGNYLRLFLHFLYMIWL